MKRKKTKFLPVMLAMLLLVSNISASMTALAAVKGDTDTSVIEVTGIGEDVSEETEDEETEGTGTEAGTEEQAEAETETEDGKDDGSAEAEPEQDESEEDADDEESGSDPDEGESETEEGEPEAEEELTEAEEDETESDESDDIEDAEADEDGIEEAEADEEEVPEEDEGAVSGAASAGTVATLGIMLLDNGDVSDESCGDAVRYTLEDGVLTITGEGDMCDWDSADDVPWSDSMDSITKVVIEDGVTSIGAYAFYDADNLVSVDFKDSVTSIGEYAFYSCDALTTVSSMKNIKEMGEYAFYNCKKLLGEVNLSSLDVIPGHAFHYDESITGLKFSDTLTYIGVSAFDNCQFNGQNIELVFPDTLEVIEEEAFYWGRGITKVEFPDSLQFIGMNAFYYCPLNGNESTTTVAPGATVITEDGNIENTEEETTYTGITVEIPDSVTSIGKNAFNWSNVEYFVVGSGVNSFDGSAFESYDLKGVIVDNTQDNVEITNQDILWGHTSNDVAIIFTNNTAIEEPNDIVCMIGDTGYSSIAAALEAAGDEETTITLVSNVEESIVIGSDQNITLDLNGYKLSGDGKESAEEQTNSYKAVIVNEGTLTITGDGTVDAVTHQTAAVSNDIGATCTIESGKFTRSKEAGTYDFEKGEGNNGGNSYYTICNQGTMTIKDGTFENSGCYSSMIENGFYYGSTENPSEVAATLIIDGGSFEGGLNCIKNDQYGSLEINDGEFSNDENQAVLMNWNEAVINGGTFSDSLYGILNESTGDLTINDGEFSNDIYSVLENQNKAVINGGTFSGSCYDMIVGIVYDGASNSSALTINGGTFNYSGEYDIIYIDSVDVSVTITGGTFNNAFTSNDTWMFYFGDDDAYKNSQELLLISGGTFRDSKAQAKSDVSEWVVDGYTQNDYGTVLPAQEAVIKVIDVDGTPLAGVMVRIFDEEGNTVAEGTTDKSGTVTFALAYGSYTVQIIDGEGRTFDHLEQTFELTESRKTVEIEFDAEPIEFAVEVEVNGITVESDSNGQYNYEKTYDGESVTLKVTAESSSDATYTYVWYETGSNATKSEPVSTDSELALENPDAGEYSYVCVVTETYDGTVIETVSVIVNVTINKASQDISYAEMAVSRSVGDEAFTNPLNETVVDGEITYKSSDESVATVDADGRVTIVAAGTAVITATARETTNYESVSASYTLTVTGEEEVKKADQDIHFAETEITYTIGDEAFTNQLIDAVGDITYKSSNESVATVDADGRVTIIGAGTTVITATASGDEYYNAGSASYTLTVKDADKENPEPTPEPVPAGEYSLTVTVVDRNGNYATGVAYEIYDSEGNLVASNTQASGEFTVTGLAEGTYTVVITNMNGYRFDAEGFDIEVGADSESITIKATNYKSTSSSSGGSSGGSGGSGSSSRSSSSSIAAEKSGKWILEGALFTYPDGSHPSNCYLNIDGEIWAFYTNGYAVNRNHESYYTAEAIAAAGNIPTATGTWEVCGWWYQYDDGTYPHNEWAQLTYDGQTYWYHFDVDGWMDDGWFNEDGNTYYLDPVYDGYRGHMVTGWQFIDGYWYYFESNGALLKSGTTPDGYTVDGNGRWIE